MITFANSRKELNIDIKELLENCNFNQKGEND